MAQISRVLRSSTGPGLIFWCPGCNEAHAIGVGRDGWQWNGNADKPVLSPSVLVRSGHFAGHFKPGVDSCWCTYNAAHPDAPAPFKCRICHSFVGSQDGSTPGRIQFLQDCTHELAGCTVDLPPWPHLD